MNKQEAIKFINSLSNDVNIEVSVADRYITSSEVEALGISRPRLNYQVKNGYVKTIPYGKQKRYLLTDILKIKKQ